MLIMEGWAGILKKGKYMKFYKVIGYNIIEKKVVWKTFFVETDDVAVDVWLNNELGCMPYEVIEV